jgi:hypothetical protein
MNPAARTLWPTLTSCYRPVETYLELLAEATGAPVPSGLSAPAVLPALDAFLLRQLARAFASAPTIIDLAADAWQGASVAGWLAGGSARSLLVPQYAQVAAPWRQQLPAIAELLNWRMEQVEMSVACPAPGALSPADWEALCTERNPLAPVLVVLTASALDETALANVLDSLFRWCPQAVVALAGLPQTGATPLFKTVLDFCAAQSAYELTLLRELSPFFHTSSLGLIHRGEHNELRVFYDRLRQAYEGNFQFLTLTQALTEITLQATPQGKPAVPYAPAIEPPTLADLRGEFKRWLWHRVLSSGFKRRLNQLRRKPEA